MADEIRRPGVHVPATYAEAGVDVEVGNRLAKRFGELARRSLRPEVIAGIGGFAGVCRMPEGVREPLLVACCDGVGTKLKVAFACGRHRTIGIDLVAMNVNDLICTGAEPLLFLDYFSTGRLAEAVAEDVVAGIVAGCEAAGCVLLGGETAEMPDMYSAGEYDLAGFAVGVVERERMIDGSRATAGDAVIGLFSSGLHSNGYSLARRVLLSGDASAGADSARETLEAVVPALGRSLADELLEPTHIYVAAVRRLRAAVDVRALVHITGGGLIDNPPRGVSSALAWRLDGARWRVPPVMGLIAERGQIDLTELRRTFNMGLGMLAVVPADQAQTAIATLGADRAAVVGELVARRDEPVEFVGDPSAGER